MGRWDTSDPNRYRGVDRALAAKIRARDHHECQRCGAPGNDVDHIINVKQGGTDVPENLQVLCSPCHQTKTTAEAATARRTRRKPPGRLRPPPKHPSEG